MIIVPLVVLAVLLALLALWFVVAVGVFTLKNVIYAPTSAVALFQSTPATGFTAFDPSHYLPAVLQINNFLDWSTLIPSLPDWDQ